MFTCIKKLIYIYKFVTIAYFIAIIHCSLYLWCQIFLQNMVSQIRSQNLWFHSRTHWCFLKLHLFHSIRSVLAVNSPQQLHVIMIKPHLIQLHIINTVFLGSSCKWVITVAVDLLYNYESLLLFILILSWLSTLGIS